MPTNVTAEYAAAERAYIQADSTKERIEALKNMLSAVPKHKGTENLRRELRARLARLKKLLDKEQKQKKAAASLFSIKKEGDARIVIVGAPNSGKSTLLASLTNAKPTIADYPFTTSKPEIGIMKYSGVNIQMIEIPPIIKSFSTTEKGPALLSIIRSADLILIAASSEEECAMCIEELKKAKIALNKIKPLIKIKRTGSKGISFIGSKIKNKEKMATLLKKHGIHNAIVIFEKESDISQLKEVLDEALVYIPAVVVMTKGASFKTAFPSISASSPQLKEELWKRLGLIRVYTKEPGYGVRRDRPIVLKMGSTVADAAKIIHKDFIERFRFARVWGSNKFAGQRVGLEHKLQDEDIIELFAK